MRPRTGVLVIAVAAAFGAGVGIVALPDRQTAGPVTPTTTTSSSTAPSSTGTAASTASALGSPSDDPGDPTTSGTVSVSVQDLLDDADLRAAGLRVEQQPADVRMELVDCGDRQSLDEVAQSGPPVQGRWEGGPVVVFQQAVSTRDPDEAAAAAADAVRILERCQRQDPGRWVYGPTHVQRLDETAEITWLGLVDGRLNTTGRAPAGEQNSGAVAIVTTGARVSVLSVNWCASAGDEPACRVAPTGSAEQFAALARAAAERLR